MDGKIIPAASVILSLVGFYLVARIWMKWRITDKEVLKARVFLDQNFLERNWLYIFLSGAVLTFHQFIGILIPMNYFARDGLAIQLSSISEPVVLVFLVILAYEWFVLIHKR